MITSSTPYGKPEDGLNALRLYLTLGVSHVASALSSKIKDLSGMIYDAMSYPGFAVVHVQSPCTEYNNTYEQLKGNPKKGIQPLAWDIPNDHDSTDVGAAFDIVGKGGVPLGLIYQAEDSVPFDQRIEEMTSRAKSSSAQELLDSYTV